MSQCSAAACSRAHAMIAIRSSPYAGPWPASYSSTRAAAEAGLAASLVLFLYTFLRIGLWHVWIKTMFWGWIAAQFALIVVAIIDPQTAAGLARASTLVIAGVGAVLIAYFALRGQD